MKQIRFVAALLAATLVVSGAANASIQITEWMYSGYGPEFIEFTNVGPTPIDLTGWSYDDDSRIPGTVSLSAYGVVAPGESVILTEGTETVFRTQWGLAPTVKIIGNNTANIGRADEINIFDATNSLVDRLAYNDQAGQGPRTQYKSCNIPASGYGFQVAQSSWVLASVGDAYGSWMSTTGDIGSPGMVIPEPGALFGLGLGLVGMAGYIRRRW
jgi:predicted extracellular nuclease